MKILLVEDNLTNQKLTLRQLQLLGRSADTVLNGQAAVNAVIQSHYDLILMDCQMPVLDGFDATIAIRAWQQQQPQQRPIVIIAMTASDLERDRGRAMAIGMNDYLTKPVRTEVLAALLDRWDLSLDKSAPTRHTVPVSPQPIASEPLPSSHLDLDYLHRLSDHTPEFELELLQIFLEDSHIHLKTLQQAVSDQDFQQIQQSAHHIKGASANVGAKQMQTLAEQLENQFASQPAMMMTQLIAELEFSLTQVQAFLNRMRDGVQATQNL